MSEEEAKERYTGKVSYFSDRGFGFILPEGEEDTKESTFFFHISEVEDKNQKDLEVGQLVSYELAPGRKGKDQAVAVKLEEE